MNGRQDPHLMPISKRQAYYFFSFFPSPPSPPHSLSHLACPGLLYFEHQSLIGFFSHFSWPYITEYKFSPTDLYYNGIAVIQKLQTGINSGAPHSSQQLAQLFCWRKRGWYTSWVSPFCGLGHWDLIRNGTVKPAELINTEIFFVFQ